MNALTLSTLLAQEQQGGGGLFSLLIIIVPLGLLVYMMIVPQRKQRQRQADMQRKLGVGSEVVTTGGIIGTITFVEDDIFHLEIDDDVVIRIAKSAVARSTEEADPADKPAAKTRGSLLGGAKKDADDEGSTGSKGSDK